MIDGLARTDRSALDKYRDFFIGRPGLWPLLRFELVMALAAARTGAAGYLLRKALFPRLFASCGRGVQFGRNIALRCPALIHIGDRTAIDDDCLLDARGADTPVEAAPESEGTPADRPAALASGLRLGADVLIARSTIVQCKCGPISIGDGCSIGSGCILSSAGGICIGKNVLVAGACYIGGGRYRTELTGAPIMHQGLYSQGPVVIGDGAWIGAGAVVLDGVAIGPGAVIGAGAVVRKDVPENSILIPESDFSLRPRPVPPEMARLFAQMRDDAAPPPPRKEPPR